MTKSEMRSRCRWCGRRFADTAGRQGRPRLYCRQSCRQRDYESRRRATEVGLSEADLIIARRELDELHDALYVLEAAIEDVDRDLSTGATKRDYEDAVRWLLEAARPLVALRLGG